MRSRLTHRLIALVLLMAYTITGTSVLPAAVAALAAMDGGHEVLVGQGKSGLRVTLHHRPGDYTPCVADHHNALARMLVRFCRPSQQGDHQLISARFEGNADDEKKSRHQWSKRPASSYTVAQFQLGQFKPSLARATSRQGVLMNTSVLQGPAFRPVLSTVQMLV